MVLHVRDDEVDRMARQLAELKGTNITVAVREALEAALLVETSRESLWDRTADIRARIAAKSKTGLDADKEFFDSLYE